MTSYSLRRNQRQLVQYFRHYHLDEDRLELPEEKPPQSVVEMLEKFDPMANKNDHRILFEVIGCKVEDADDEQFEEESDGEDSEL